MAGGRGMAASVRNGSGKDMRRHLKFYGAHDRWMIFDRYLKLTMLTTSRKTSRSKKRFSDLPLPTQASDEYFASARSLKAFRKAGKSITMVLGAWSLADSASELCGCWIRMPACFCHASSTSSSVILSWRRAIDRADAVLGEYQHFHRLHVYLRAYSRLHCCKAKSIPSDPMSTVDRQPSTGQAHPTKAEGLQKRYSILVQVPLYCNGDQ